MSNYTKNVDYASKDGLNTGDPLKVIRGTEIDAEFDEIEDSIATKPDAANGTHTGTTSVQNITVSGTIDGGAIDGGTY